MNFPGYEQITRQLQIEFRPGRLLASFNAGLISGVLTIIMVTAFAAMIFSGQLSIYVSSGLSFVLFGAFVIGIVVALTSSYAGTVARPHEIPAAILTLISTTIVSSMPFSGAGEGVFLTVVAAIILTSLLTGTFFLLLGLFKIGDLIRFIPYPVVGGFLAGTGLLLVKGAIRAMTDLTLSLTNLPYLFQFDVLIKWLPGLVLALLILFILRRYNNVLIMPAILLMAVGLFYSVLFFTDITLAEIRSQGWLLGPFQEGVLRQPLSFSSLSQVNWSLIFGQTGKIGTILIISCISLLLNASGLELIVRREIDLNRELKSVGIANILAGFGSGTVGFHSLSLSALGHKMGASSRLVGIFSALLCAGTLFFGTSLLSFFPKPVIGSLLLFLGFTFLSEWVYDAWFKLSRTDYSLVLLILAVIGTFGFLEGVGVGVLVAVVLFVIKYSRVSVVKHILSGVNYQSNVDRAEHQRRLLNEKGEQIYILKLQGYIFFGTANNLLNQVRRRVEDNALPQVRFVILDFRLVNGLDSSALNSFIKMRQFAEMRQITLIFTHLPLELQQKFDRGGLNVNDNVVFRTFPDLDHGVEWCEDQILVAEKMALTKQEQTLQEQLGESFPESVNFNRFMKYLERQEAAKGYYLMHQGDPPHSLYFIESGQVTVQLETEKGEAIRLRTMGAGTVVGELGLYLRLRSTASVVTEQPSIIYRLTVNALKEMEETDPEIAAAFHKFIVHLLGERLANTNKSLQALLD